jgi:predicted NACHT family NTPase
MVAEIAAGWAFGKIADLVWDGAKGTLHDKLTKTDIERAVAAGLKAAQAWNEGQPVQQRLFCRCDTVQQDKFKSKVFADAGVQAELIKPLTNQGQPDLAFLVAKFKQIATDLKVPITESALEPWLNRFATTFLKQTQTFIRYQIARADYLQQLANWFDDVKFAGIAVAGQEVERSEQLAQIFVMPEVQEEVSSSSSFDLAQHGPFYLQYGAPITLQYGAPITNPDSNRQLQLLQEQRFRAERDSSGRKLLAAQVLKQNQSKLVLLGAPGSGKTTLLSYFAVMLARDGAAELGLEIDCLPILIRIRDWARQPDLSLPEYARQFAEKTMSVKPLPVGFFEYWLDGRALILLDGLDEVAEASKRHHVVQCIENFLGQYRQNRAVITSRPAGYRRDFFRTDEYPHYQLLPFGDAQQQEFINRWYDSRIADPAEAERRKASLRKAFSDNERIKLLARNPLLLTIIALIHRYQAVLPKQRFKLYEKAVETLLTAWDSNKELSNQTVLKYLDLDDLQRLMERVAYWIHTQGGTGDLEGGTLIDRDMLLDTLCEEIQTQKQVQRYQAKEEAERFVNFIRDRTGLLNEQGQDCYAFVHKTFQEYLTAQEIIYQAENEGDFEIVLNHIRDHLHDPHWEEVLLLLIAQQKPNNAAKAISAVLDHNSPYEKWLHRDLFFAGRCLAENPKGLKTAKGSRTDEILTKLVELEAFNEDCTGSQVKEEVKRVLCSLYETDFAAPALAMLKQVENIDDFRLKNYRIELGDEQAVVIQEYLELLHHKKLKVRSNAAEAIGKQGVITKEIINGLIEFLREESISGETRY